MAHGHAAPAAVKNALYDVVTRHFNGEMDSKPQPRPRWPRPSPPPRADRLQARCPGDRPGHHSSAGSRRSRTMAIVSAAAPSAAPTPRVTLQELLPKLVLAPSFALILLFVYGFIIFTGVLSFSGSKLMPDLSTWVGFGNYVRLFKHPELDDLAQESGDLRHRSTSSSAACSASAWRSCSTRRSAAKVCCGRSTSIRWRCPSSSPASPGNGSSIPASASSTSMHDLGLGELLLPLDQGRQDGDLHDRHRRRLAVVRLRHGDVPGRPARRRQRDHQGGADRRRLDRSRSIAASSSR